MTRKPVPAASHMLRLLSACLLFVFSAGASLAGERTGTFTGAGGHVSSGKISIEVRDDATYLVFAGDFKLDGAPDPRVGFGKSGFTAGSDFAKLESLSGAQTYRVPASVNLSDVNEIWLWCRRFNVPLAVAKLN